jgi:hypothetical protein
MILKLSRCTALAILAALPLAAVTASSSATLFGRLLDDRGQPVAGAQVTLLNRSQNFKQVVRSDGKGAFRLFNLPFHEYHLEVEAPGLEAVHQNVELRATLPVDLTLTLKPAGAVVAVEEATAIVEDHPSSHVDLSRTLIEQIPTSTQNRAMEEVLLTTPGFIADENGRFHFRGSHGQVTYVIDGIPISDQVQATFSNTLDPGQAESMEVITGGISAEYGGKPGAVVNLTSKSGLGTPNGFQGEVSLGAARFGTREAGAEARGGTDTFGYFVTVAASESDRFLDPVNFENLHNHGTTDRVFSRFDWILGSSDTLRFSLSGGDTNREVVNLASQQGAGQNQRVGNRDANTSLGWTHLFNANASLDVAAYYRHSTSQLTPTRDLQAGFGPGGPDGPFWASQDRSLDNLGLQTGYTLRSGENTFKAGLQYVRFPIHERFAFAITDPGQVTDPSDPLYPFTPDGGGHSFRFDDRITPTLASAYVQDDYKVGNVYLAGGLRYDRYTGRNVTQGELQPRLGLSYTCATGTILRAAYDRLMITPENEGLALSTSQQVWTVTSGLDTPVAKLRPEIQDSFLVGVEQQLGRIAKVTLEYWWKDCTNAADNSQFLNTGVLFPIAAAKGRFHGLDLRFDMISVHGWSGYLSAGTVRTMFYDPTVGGLDAATTSTDTNPYLIDHDQKLTLQLGIRYEQDGFYGQVLGRYDSGLEAGDPTTVAGNPDYDFGIPFVRLQHDSLVGDNYRIRPRTVWNLSLGQKFKLTERRAVQVSMDLLNAFDEKGLYNFLSTFGGTHVIPPRTLAARIKYSF